MFRAPLLLISASFSSAALSPSVWRAEGPIFDRPAIARGDPAQPWRGIDADGMPEQAEYFGIGVVIGVGVGGAAIDRMSLGELAGEQGFTLAIRVQPGQLAGVAPRSERERRADDRLDPQIPRQQFDQELRCPG